MKNPKYSVSESFLQPGMVPSVKKHLILNLFDFVVTQGVASIFYASFCTRIISVKSAPEF
jgi:lipoprotein signal peptidase